MAYEQFSSFQIGKMLNVSRQAVNQWIDKGYIHSYRTPGGHRRVRREDLFNFLKARNIPVPPVLQSFTPEAGKENLLPESEVGRPLAMFVDDDREFTALLINSLRKNFPEIAFQAFDNGFDALVAMGNNPPLVLTLDLKLANIDGIEICRRLKSNELTREISIVIVTAQDNPEWRTELAKLGITNICLKSNAFSDIVEKISSAIRAELVA